MAVFWKSEDDHQSNLDEAELSAAFFICDVCVSALRDCLLMCLNFSFM